MQMIRMIGWRRKEHRGTDENHRDSNQKNTAIVIYAVVRQTLRYNKLEENGTGKTVLDVIKSGYKILVKTNNLLN